MAAPGSRRAPPRAAKQRAAPHATGPSQIAPRHNRATRSATRVHPVLIQDGGSQSATPHSQDVPQSSGRKRPTRSTDGAEPEEMRQNPKRARLRGPAEDSSPVHDESGDDLNTEPRDASSTSRGRRRVTRGKLRADPSLSPATDEDDTLPSGAHSSQTRSAKAKSSDDACNDASDDVDMTSEEPAVERTQVGSYSLPWSDLPYMIWVDIFSFAAAPLDSIGLVRWLVAASTACRTLSEPAITALYKRPPLLTMAMSHNLAVLLAKSPSETLFNYRQKIEALSFDVGLHLAPTYKGRHLSISTMLQNLPRLADLDLFHQKDQPPYRQLSERTRWTYPADLCRVLAAEPDESSQAEGGRSLIRLRSWRWSTRMTGPELTFKKMKSIHASRGFAALSKITFVNYQRPSSTAKNASDTELIAMDKQQAEEFADMLGALPSLTHLVLECCTVANEHLLPLLPNGLRHLELLNCWDVLADSVASYLSTSGYQLRHLTLYHNQSLNLAFLPLLGTCCPKLESLQMDLTYYKLHEFYVDSQPNYDELLLPEQVPTWPRSIQVVELENLRKWSPEAAEAFLQSLIDSAPDLPALRHLGIKARLDIPWRQRSAIRDQWERRLKDCFLRRPQVPNRWRSIADVPQKRVVEAAMRQEEKRRKQKLKLAAESGESSRRSERISTQASSPSSRASSVGRGLRRAGRGPVSYREPDSDDDSDDFDGTDNLRGESDAGGSPLASGNEDVSSPTSAAAEFIHGLCDVVDVRFDNQKPMERQYVMEDFLDSDDTMSDEDWDGDHDGGEDTYAW